MNKKKYISNYNLFAFLLCLIFLKFSYAQNDLELAQKKMEKLYSQNNMVGKYEKIPNLEEINLKTVPACKAEFIKICGSLDFPALQGFSACLNKNYENIQKNKDCSNLAYALLHATRIAGIGGKTPKCESVYFKCMSDVMQKKTTKGFLVCAAEADSGIPLCTLLANLVIEYRRSLAQIFDLRMVAN